MKHLFYLIFCVVCVPAISAENIRETLGNTGLSIQIPLGFESPIASYGGCEPSITYYYVDSNGASHFFPSFGISVLCGDNTLKEYIDMLTERSEIIVSPQPHTIANISAIEFAIADIVMTPDSVPTQQRVVTHMFIFEHQGQRYRCYLEANSQEHDEFTSKLYEFCNSILITPNKAAQMDGYAATGLSR